MGAQPWLVPWETNLIWGSKKGVTFPLPWKSLIAKKPQEALRGPLGKPLVPGKEITLWLKKEFSQVTCNKGKPIGKREPFEPKMGKEEPS